MEICPSPCREPTKLSPTLFHATGWPVMLLLSAHLTLFSLLLTASDRDPSAHAHADVKAADVASYFSLPTIEPITSIGVL